MVKKGDRVRYPHITSLPNGAAQHSELTGTVVEVYGDQPVPAARVYDDIHSCVCLMHISDLKLIRKVEEKRKAMSRTLTGSLFFLTCWTAINLLMSLMSLIGV